MKQENLEKYFYALSDKIMSCRLTPEQASAVITYLRKKYPFDSEYGKIYGQVMIETGAGESLLMRAQFAEGKKASEQFAEDFAEQV